MHFLQESEHILLARILQDNAIVVRFLQVNSFLPRSFQAINFLQNFSGITFLARYLQESCKISIICKNLERNLLSLVAGQNTQTQNTQAQNTQGQNT